MPDEDNTTKPPQSNGSDTESPRQFLNSETRQTHEKTKTKKKVRFAKSEPGSSSSVKATIAGYVPDRNEISIEEYRTVWWNKRELEQLLLSARSMCRNRRDDMQLSSHLNKAYDAISEKVELNPLSTNNNHANAKSTDSLSSSNDTNYNEEFSINDRYLKRATNQLRKWELHSDYRGLETWSNYQHELSRENAQRELTRKVLAVQRTHRMKYGRISEKGSKESDTLWKGVSHASHTQSRHAKLFAYSMGLADASEVGIEVYPKKEKGLFKKMAKAVLLFKR